MQSENVDRSTIEILQSNLERVTKTIAAFGAFVYIIGFVITAQRLAQYGVSTIELLDAQYFMAGIVPSLLIWITAFVVLSALRFELIRDHEARNVTTKWIWINILFGIPIFILVVLSLLSPDWFENAWSRIYPAPVPIILFLGEISLWILVIGLKKSGFAIIVGTASNKSSLFRRALIVGGIIYVLCLVLITMSTLVGIPLLGIQVYEQIPQVYGGGQSLIVELYANSQDLPYELFPAESHEVIQPKSRYTLPVHLILRTTHEFIVDPIGDCVQRAWVISADAVLATAELDDLSKFKLMESRCNY